MNREEILAMNRKENEGREDEREMRILADAARVGMTVGGILCVLMVFFARILEIPILAFGAWAVYFAMFGSYRAYQYSETKARTNLVQAIIGIAVGTAFIVATVVMGLQR